MPSAWNMFVKKIYQEGKSKDSSYEFKQALVDASKRKSEMTSAPVSAVKKRTASRRSRGRKMSSALIASMAGGRRTRRHRSRRHRR